MFYRIFVWLMYYYQVYDIDLVLLFDINNRLAALGS